MNKKEIVKRIRIRITGEDYKEILRHGTLFAMRPVFTISDKDLVVRYGTEAEIKWFYKI